MGGQHAAGGFDAGDDDIEHGHSPLVAPDRRGLLKSWCWLLLGAALFIPANLLPMLKMNAFWGLAGGTDATILQGVYELARHGDWAIAAVVFVASILVPSVKFGAIAWLAAVAGRSSTPRAAHRRLILFEIVEFIGRWSMIDVFVVVIMSALVQLGVIAEVQPGPAVGFFVLSVVATMLAALSFDPRLIWRSLMPRGHDAG